MKKTLVIIFCTGNAREEVNIDEDIIDAKDYLNDNIARDNNLATNQENIDIKLRNYEKNAEKSLEKLFANVYKNNELVQAIIDAKIRSMRKLPCKILKQINLSIGDLNVKDSKLYIKSNIYVPNDKNFWLYLLRQQYNFFEQRYPNYKAMFQACKTDIFGLI